MNSINCEHKRISSMTWPDGGCSELCTDCLLTRLHDGIDQLDWQDHKYETVSDWYQEAADFQKEMDKI